MNDILQLVKANITHAHNDTGAYLTPSIFLYIAYKCYSEL